MAKLDEISDKLRTKYILKAAAKRTDAENYHDFFKRSKTEYGKKRYSEIKDTLRKRNKGIAMANKGYYTKKLKENSEPLEELGRIAAIKKAYKDKSGRYKMDNVDLASAGINSALAATGGNPVSHLNALVAGTTLAGVGAAKGADIVKKYRKYRKEETLQELSRRVLGPYVKKAMASKDCHLDMAVDAAKRVQNGHGDDYKTKQHSRMKGHLKKVSNRTDGINRALDKITREDVDLTDKIIDRIFIMNEDRKESTKVVKAFLDKTSAKGKRSHTDGTGLYLHGHKIAWHGEGGAIHGTLAGWGTTTTRDRLNTLTRHVHGRSMFSQKKGVQHYDNKPIGAHDHVTIRDAKTD